ncbi:hypothetical protein [Trinickia soli]|uniref:Uncharacterized protein n=1 Tax=Trinickia soli TaxID=380675 RepID=A0A2N7VE44_9BURK|nr:hypothetical protein [Trinickia soli]KAA0079552.1 hypothetical protein CIW54_24425 [Paraburkholderia sp. T12-10]PMS15431.1 hypothetical protein C0Z19_27505 [Trinickia soli]
MNAWRIVESDSERFSQLRILGTRDDTKLKYGKRGEDADMKTFKPAGRAFETLGSVSHAISRTTGRLALSYH